MSCDICICCDMDKQLPEVEGGKERVGGGGGGGGGGGRSPVG